MNKLFLNHLAMFCLLALSACGDGKTTEQWEIKRGMNLSHWLSQNGRSQTGVERYAHVSEKDFATIAAAGFDHVRLPIDEKELWTEDGQKIPYTFGLLHQAIEWCKKYDLRVLVDLHIIRSHHFNSEAENTLFTEESSQQILLNLWRDLSDELKQYPNHFMAYELMNEPVAAEHDQWNQLVARMVTQIREQEPERKLFIGSNRWQGLDYLKYLEVPANDPNLVISFHYYEPFLITHYKASWMPDMQIPFEVNYPGELFKQSDLDQLSAEQKDDLAWTLGNFDIDFMDERISIAVQRAKELGLPLYCGEFGCIYPNMPAEVRENWFRDVVAVFEKYDIPYTVWDYKGTFKVFEADNTPTNSYILKTLTGK